jgi:7-cyano-7-deazaguanine tRNA-ribosyltransferase
LKSDEFFELKATDLGGRIGTLSTKSSDLETPALLPVVHPFRQLVPCSEIRSMGYEAVMTNAYTTYKRQRVGSISTNRIHEIIGFDGTVMTDSGGYQLLKFGTIDIEPQEMAKFEEKIESDIAIILDRPTGLEVTRSFASSTVEDTLSAARRTKKIISRDNMIWTLPIQGGKYLDLVTKSARESAKLAYDCYALGSPVEVMEQYDFPLLVQMILASKKHLPQNRPFHLFGAGHPLILPLAIALGCDMFDSASYMLYAKQDRYISLRGTIRLDQLEYFGCNCKQCTAFTPKEMKSLPREERILSLARHNLWVLRQIIRETRQAIWEGRLWEYVQSTSRCHPRVYEAFRIAVKASEKSKEIFEIGTPAFKDRGMFIFEKIDISRPEITRYRHKLGWVDFSKSRYLLILPETRTKPFLKSKIFEEIRNILHDQMERNLVTFLCPNFGLVPAELSDVFPLSQYTNAYYEFPTEKDVILNRRAWIKILALAKGRKSPEAEWLRSQLGDRDSPPRNKFKKSKNTETSNRSFANSKKVRVTYSYRDFKRLVRQNILSID